MNILQSYLHDNRAVQNEFENHLIQKISGDLPDELNGYLFHNGNGNHQQHGIPYQHIFDGDGLINKFEFRPPEVFYSNTYVKTNEFLKEARAGKMLYRSFGTNLPGGWVKNAGKVHFKNTANTNIIYHADRMLALWEGGVPHLIDPSNLKTISRYYYDKMLRNKFGWWDQKIQPELPFSAHPKMLSQDQTLYNFGISPGGFPRLILYRIDARGKGEIEQVIRLQKLHFTHDFALTDKKQKIFFLTPVSFNIGQALLGFKSPLESLTFEEDKNTTILVVDQGQTVQLPTDFCFIFHFINAYQQEDGKIIVDALKMPGFPNTDLNKRLMQGDQNALLHAIPTRYTIDLAKKEMHQEKLFDLGMELPTIHAGLRGKNYRYAYGIGYTKPKTHNMLQEIVKIDLHNRTFISRDFPQGIPSEPLMVPKPGSSAEDEGWLIFTRYEANLRQTLLTILDAKNLDILYEGKLPHNIPMGFHGTWINKNEQNW